MENKVQLITYADRFGQRGIAGIQNLMKNQLKGTLGGVHLLPFYYPIDGADAGYDPIDHTEVDVRIGSWEDVESLSKDFEIMGDIIVNHVSAQSREFLDVVEKGSKSAYFDLFLTKDKVFPNGATEEEISSIYRPRPNLPFTELTLNNGEKLNLWTTFTSNQLDIDVQHPLGVKYLESILEKFSKAGIKMIRLDAAGYAIKKAGTSCFMLPETYQFIDDFTQKAKAKGMEVLVEIHSHFEQQIKIAEKVDYVYDFALPPLILHSIRSKRFNEIKYWLSISPRNSVTVLDTHDGIGVIDVAKSADRPGLLEDEDVDLLVESIHQNSGGESRKATGAAASNLDLYQVNCTFYSALGCNDKDYLIARAIQFFSPGIPQVYYVGMMAGENDMKLLEETQVGRDINRHYYSETEIEKTMVKPVVKDLMKLMKFRNEHPSFGGLFKIEESDENSLHISWTKDYHRSELKVNLVDETFEIIHTEGLIVNQLELSVNNHQFT